MLISDFEGIQGKLLGLKMISKVFCMVIIRKDSLLHTVPKRRGTPLHTSQGHTGKHETQSGGRRNEGKVWTKSALLISQEGMGEAE